MALASPLITATCIEATEFIELSRQFRVNGVPKTVVNGEVEIHGGNARRRIRPSSAAAATA
jgi:hypothetical protein